MIDSILSDLDCYIYFYGGKPFFWSLPRSLNTSCGDSKGDATQC